MGPDGDRDSQLGSRTPMIWDIVLSQEITFLSLDEQQALLTIPAKLKLPIIMSIYFFVVMEKLVIFNICETLSGVVRGSGTLVACLILK